MADAKGTARAKAHPRWDVGVVTATDQKEINEDDSMLLTALSDEHLTAEMVAWDDKSVAWDQYRLLVIRSTWNYYTQRDKFLHWAQLAARKSSLWNRYPTIRWNTDKSYLRDLEAQGVPIVPTKWMVKGTKLDLGKVLEEPGWSKIVAKPTVSANAWHTFVVEKGNQGAGQKMLDEYLRSEDMMIQPYMESVETVGEHSVIYIRGRFSHVVRKEPVLLNRDLRLEATPSKANPEQLALAKASLAACPEPTLYARIDMIEDPSHKWRVGEVEITEPSLFLAHHPPAAQALAAGIRSIYTL